MRATTIPTWKKTKTSRARSWPRANGTPCSRTRSYESGPVQKRECSSFTEAYLYYVHRRSGICLRGDRWPHLYGNFAAYQSTNDAFIDAHIVRVSGQVAGRLQSVYLDDNQSLNKGDLIVELDPHDFNAAARQKAAALASSQAQAAAAQAAVQEAIAHVKTEEATVESDQATAAADAAQNDKAQSDLEHR
jgi:hypothetical protein